MIKMIRYFLYELRYSLIYKIGVFVVIPLILVPLAVYMDLAGLELRFILLYIIVGILPAKLLFDLVYFKLSRKLHFDITSYRAQLPKEAAQEKNGLIGSKQFPQNRKE